MIELAEIPESPEEFSIQEFCENQWEIQIMTEDSLEIIATSKKPPTIGELNRK